MEYFDTPWLGFNSMPVQKFMRVHTERILGFKIINEYLSRIQIVFYLIFHISACITHALSLFIVKLESKTP
jgi:hypothetical protein